MEADYLNATIKQFEYYKALGDKTIAQLSEDQLFFKLDGFSNSIAVIVNHLHGNMRSRWTNFLSEDGEKDWRNRDAEFMDIITSKSELLDRWEEGWMCLFEALYSITPTNFNQPIFIRNQQHTIIEAFNRQMTHYAYHVGQIVFIGKHLKSADWKSLSIPKGKSAQFNEEKFTRGKHGGHYTDDLK